MGRRPTAHRSSVVRHTDGLLLRLALARLTFSRMSLAFAVQMKGLVARGASLEL